MSGEGSFRQRHIASEISEHEERITELERFKLMAQGAMALAAFMIGSGFVTAIALFALT